MDTLFSHVNVVTMNEQMTLWQDAFVGVTDGKIAYMAKKPPEEKPKKIIDATGMVLMPGLINCHTHLPMYLLRGYADDLNLQDWLQHYIFPREDRLDGRAVKAATTLALAEALRFGTTSVSDMYYFCDATADCVIESGIKANISRALSAFDPNEAYKDSYRVKEALALYDSYNGAADGRLKIDLSVHAEYTCLESIARRHSEKCKELGAIMHIHLSETKSEHDTCIEKYGKTPARWFYDLGAFDSPTLAAHCVWVTDEDIALMKECGVSPVHCPTSNLKLGSGFARVQHMLKEGLNVGLGTDGAASNNNLNMLEELHLCSVVHNGYNQDPTIMNPNDTVKMATLNGAKIQGRTDCGGIKVGNRADIIALNFDKPHLLPAFDPLAMLCYSAQGSDVCMTMVDGRILYENGEFLTMDKERIYHDVKKALKHLYS